ncbi:hypothetical protein ABIE32_002215 [Comamonas sp. 4034]
MSLRRKIALWLCPELGEAEARLLACRAGWSKQHQAATEHEGIAFVNFEQDYQGLQRSEAREMLMLTGEDRYYNLD